MKQSSIEWFVQEISREMRYGKDLCKSDKNFYDEIIEEAIAMHKKEIIGAHGEEQSYLEDDGSWRRQTAEEYYEETFNTEEE